MFDTFIKSVMFDTFISQISPFHRLIRGGNTLYCVLVSAEYIVYFLQTIFDIIKCCLLNLAFQSVAGANASWQFIDRS